MLKHIIEDKQELSRWIYENGGFPDFYIKSLSPTVKNKQNVAFVEMSFGYQIEGNYHAGHPKKDKEFVVRFLNVKNWDYKGDTRINFDACYEGMDLIEDSVFLSIGLDTGFQIDCEIVEVVKETIVKSITKPFVSDRTIHVWLPADKIPTPKKWIELLENEPGELAWRIYGGPAVQPEVVPSEYIGWFIQAKELISKSSGGLFFNIVKKESITGFGVEKQDRDEKHLWERLLNKIGDLEFQKVQNGNCFFTKEKWKTYRTSGILPAFTPDDP